MPDGRRRRYNHLPFLTLRCHAQVRCHSHPVANESGDPSAAGQLLPLVYDELRKLAAQKMAQEKPGQTLEATALVHEAYLRLVKGEAAQHWNSRGHFFAAAAQAMRRILVDQARRRNDHRQFLSAKPDEINLGAGGGLETHSSH